MISSPCDAAGVEGTHGKLSTGFADGLSRDDADGFACADGLADRKVDAVALCAHAGASLAGQDAADEHSLDAVRLKDLCVRRHEHMIGIKQHLAGLRIADGNSPGICRGCWSPKDWTSWPLS